MMSAIKRIFILSVIVLGGVGMASAQGNRRPPRPDKVCSGALGAHSFDRLIALVNGRAFDDDKFLVIEAASLGGYFTCDQAVALMSCFRWADKKLKVLEYVAPHLVDLRDAKSILDQFTFDSEKERAWSIISGAPRR